MLRLFGNACQSLSAQERTHPAKIDAATISTAPPNMPVARPTPPTKVGGIAVSRVNDDGPSSNDDQGKFVDDQPYPMLSTLGFRFKRPPHQKTRFES